jgi:hypothetical protein
MRVQRVDTGQTGFCEHVAVKGSPDVRAEWLALHGRERKVRGYWLLGLDG